MLKELVAKEIEELNTTVAKSRDLLASAANSLKYCEKKLDLLIGIVEAYDQRFSEELAKQLKLELEKKLKEGDKNGVIIIEVPACRK